MAEPRTQHGMELIFVNSFEVGNQGLCKLCPFRLSSGKATPECLSAECDDGYLITPETYSLLRLKGEL